jgi:Spy/CpxP family protein refolding chaperone
MKHVLSAKGISSGLLVVSLAFNVTFVATFVLRQWQHHRGEEGHEEFSGLRDLHNQLRLTEEQQEQMRQSKESLLRQVEKLQGDLATERQVLAELLTAPEPDQDAIALQLDRIADIQRLVQRAVIDHLLEERALLRPEQRETFNEIILRRVFPHGTHGPESSSGGLDRGGMPTDDGPGRREKNHD